MQKKKRSKKSGCALFLRLTKVTGLIFARSHSQQRGEKRDIYNTYNICKQSRRSAQMITYISIYFVRRQRTHGDRAWDPLKMANCFRGKNSAQECKHICGGAGESWVRYNNFSFILFSAMFQDVFFFREENYTTSSVRSLKIQSDVECSWTHRRSCSARDATWIRKNWEIWREVFLVAIKNRHSSTQFIFFSPSLRNISDAQ